MPLGSHNHAGPYPRKAARGHVQKVVPVWGLAHRVECPVNLPLNVRVQRVKIAKACMYQGDVVRTSRSRKMEAENHCWAPR